MTKLEKGLIAAALALAIAVPAGVHVFGVRSVDTKLTRLKTQIEQAMRDRDSSDRLLSLRQEEWAKLSTEIDRLRLFDLRKEERFETVMINRSNLGLIALSEIFEKNGVAIDALEPQPSRFSQVLIAEAPQAGVVSRRYALRARGPYQSLLKVYAAFATLPPTLELGAYEVEYLDNDGKRATVSLKLDLAFNYLMTPEQLAQAEAAEKQAAPTDAPAPVSWMPRGLWSSAMAWLMPPAYAQSPAPVKPYTLPIRKDTTLGRSEPFMPLAPAGSGSIGFTAPPKPRLEVALIGVLLGDGVPGAIVSTDGQRLRVRPGTVLPNGAEVMAIADGYVLIRHAGAIHRVGLSRDPGPRSAPAPASPLEATPPTVPGMPAFPAVPNPVMPAQPIGE